MLIAQDMWMQSDADALKGKKRAEAREEIRKLIATGPYTGQYLAIAADLVEARGHALALESSGKVKTGKRKADLDREIDAFVKYSKYG